MRLTQALRTNLELLQGERTIFQIAKWVNSFLRFLSAAPLFARNLKKLPGPPNGAAGFGAGVFSVLQNLDSVYKHVLHSHGVLMRFLVGGFISDCLRVEDSQIGEVASLDEAAAVLAQVGCRQV